MNKPLFTIGIPTYNRLEYLKIAIESALNQTFLDFEIIVSLDKGPFGHHMGIMDYLNNIIKQKGNIHVHFTEKNLGLAGNWNRLAQLSQAKYMVLIGDDDVLFPNFLENMAAGASKNADVIFGNQQFIDHNGKIVEFDPNLFYKRDELKLGFLLNAQKAIWRNSIPMSASSIKTKCILENKFRLDLNTPELEFFLRLEKSNNTFFFTPEILMSYRVHPSSATASGLKVHLLYEYLLHFPVSFNNKPFKETFLRNISQTAASRYLKTNQRKRAIKIILSKYYPKWHWKLIYHIWLLILPFRIESK